MPELPEVEVLRRSLEPHLLGRRFTAVEVHSPMLREPLRRRQLLTLVGKRIVALRRRAKYLCVDVSGDRTLVVHLGMSGRLTVTRGQHEPAPHEHVTFRLSSGRSLRFRDPRRFGLVIALDRTRLEEDRHFSALGVEPLGPDFDGSRLQALARGRRCPVKSFLMDARTVVGVGNIYASEALFRAGIHPRRSVARISRERFDRLAACVREVLEQAIREGGTTLNDYTNGDGESGLFQVSLAVYGRESEPCRSCGEPVRRIVQQGRSTFYCPVCQR